MHKPMGSICILGTSLISCLYIKELRDYFQIYVYESANIGGAWSSKPIGSCRDVPLYNNIICPLSFSEEVYISQIFDLLGQSRCSDLHINKLSLDLAIKYRPHSYILGNFSAFIHESLDHPNVHIKSQSIDSVSINNDNIGINNQCFFSLFLLPENYSIPSITIDDNSISPVYQTHTSRHVRGCIDCNLPSVPRYSENFDNVFDRGGVNRYDNVSIFTGRIRRQSKHLDLPQIINTSNFLKSIDSEYLNFFEINSYCHTFSSQYASIRKSIHDVTSRVIFYESRQFVKSYASYISTSESIKRCA